MSLVEGAQTAGLNPVTAALTGITGLAAGGPSSAYSGGGNSAGSGSTNIGGNNAPSSSGSFLSDDLYGVPVVVVLGVLGIIGLKIVK